jgi:flagellar motor switch protein FliN/FliY
MSDDDDDFGGDDMDWPDLEDQKVPEGDNAPANNYAADDRMDVEIQPAASDLEAVFDVPVNVSAVLGKTQMEVSDLLKLGRGAVVELDRKVGEAIDIYVNNRLVARGEVVVVEERLGVTMTEIIKGDAG